MDFLWTPRKAFSREGGVYQRWEAKDWRRDSRKDLVKLSFSVHYCLDNSKREPCGRGS